jgi:transposase
MGGMTEHVTLSRKELDRLQIITHLAERRLTQRQAGELLGITERQVRRIVRSFEARGAASLASTKRGRPSHRRLPQRIRDRALALVREHYTDFGPTLAHEKLTEKHGLALCVETLRVWMIADGIWLPRSKRAKRSHPPRERRDCLGQLVQISTAASTLGSRAVAPVAPYSSTSTTRRAA